MMFHSRARLIEHLQGHAEALAARKQNTTGGCVIERLESDVLVRLKSHATCVDPRQKRQSAAQAAYPSYSDSKQCVIAYLANAESGNAHHHPHCDGA